MIRSPTRAQSRSSNGGDNTAKLMMEFLKKKKEPNQKELLQLFNILEVIDLVETKEPFIHISSLLFLATLKKVIYYIDKKGMSFRLQSVIACAEMVAFITKYFLYNDESEISNVNMLFDEVSPMCVVFSEKDIPPLAKRKLVSINSFSPLLSFLRKYDPSIRNVKDFFGYALVISLDRLGISNMISVYLTNFPIQKYRFMLTPETFTMENETPQSLIERSKALTPPINPIIILLVRYASNRLFGKMDFKYFKIPNLIETIISYLEEDSEYKIDELVNLLIYYSGDQIDIPVHLTYTNANHFLFFIALALTNHYQEIDSSILLSTISFEYSPNPSIALVLAHNLNKSFIIEFIQHALQSSLSQEWSDIIHYLSQFLKLPPKMEDLVEQAKGQNISAIKKLLADPQCVPLLKPDEFLNHKLLYIYHTKDLKIPEEINFDRADAFLFFRLKSSEKHPNQTIIWDILKNAAKIVSKMTKEISKYCLPLRLAIYSGIKPPQIQYLPKLNPLSTVVDFFYPEISSPFQNISSIVSSLLFFLDDSLGEKDMELLTMVFRLNNHYFLCLNQIDCGTKIFGKIYKEFSNKLPIVYFLKSIEYVNDTKKIEATKQKYPNCLQINENEVIELFQQIIISPQTKPHLIYLLKQLYASNNEYVFSRIVQMVPSIVSQISTNFSNEEVMKIIMNLFNYDLPQSISILGTKLISDGNENELFSFLASKSIEKPDMVSNICYSMTKSNKFAQYFFDHIISFIPEKISFNLAYLIKNLSTFLTPISFEYPSYPKLKPESVSWKEDHELLNKEEEEEECYSFFESNAIQKAFPDFPYSTTDKPSIWEIPLLEHCSFIDTGTHYEKQPFFKCLTCNLIGHEGTCEYCAIHCHKGHLVYFSETTSAFCDCFEREKTCLSNPRNSLHAQTIENQKSLHEPDEHIQIHSKSAIDFILKFSHSEFTDEIPDLNSVPLRQLKYVKYSNLVNLCDPFTMPSLPILSQLKSIISKNKIPPQISERRVNIKPFDLVSIIQPQINNEECHIICYANGKSLVSSVYDHPDISYTLNIDDLIYSIVTYGNSLIAAISNTSVYIIEVSNDPLKLNLIQRLIPNQASLMFFYIDAVFLNNEAILLLSNFSISVRNFRTGEQLCEFFADKSSFTSFAVFKHQNSDFVIVGNVDGQAILYSMSPNCALTFHSTINFASFCNSPNVAHLNFSSFHEHLSKKQEPKVFISYSKDYNIIFVSFEKSNMICCRPCDLFLENIETVTIDAIQTHAILVSSNIDQNLLLFASTDGSIFAMALKSNALYVSKIQEDKVLNQQKSDNNSSIFLGAFVLDKFMHILSSDGIFYKVLINNINPVFSTTPIFNEEENQEVPVTFWSRTKTNPSNVKLSISDIGPLPTSNSLNHLNITIRPNLSIVFTAKPQDRSFTIVGIRLFINVPKDSHSKIECRGKLYPILPNFPTCIALNPDEINPGNSVSFTVLQNKEVVTIQSIFIHCMKTDEITIPRPTIKHKRFDWMTDCTNVFDFSEPYSSESSIDFKAHISLNIAKNFIDDGSTDINDIYNIIMAMYQCPEISIPCRMILLRSKLDREEIQRIWIKAIQDTIDQKKVHQSLVQVLWRDFSLIDRKYKNGIQAEIWKKIDQLSGMYCFISAFI